MPDKDLERFNEGSVIHMNFVIIYFIGIINIIITVMIHHLSNMILGLSLYGTYSVNITICIINYIIP